MNILNRIKNIIKAGRILSTIDTTRIKISTLGKEQPALLIMPYGIEIDPIVNNVMCLLLSESGNEDSMFALPVDIDKIATTKMIIRDDNKIIFEVDGAAGGDFLARFNELKAGFDTLKNDFNNLVTQFNLLAAHGHPVQVVPATGTGATTGIIPVVTGTSSAASIDSAKIDNMEVPG